VLKFIRYHIIIMQSSAIKIDEKNINNNAGCFTILSGFKNFIKQKVNEIKQ